jgi:hypothetical protein
LHVVDGEPQMLDFPEHDLSLLAVPWNPSSERPKFMPPGMRRWNVLLMHAAVEGMLGPYAPSQELWSPETPQDELHADEWDYIGLGHYHVYRQVRSNQFYSGATDYTSTDIWGELNEEALSGVPSKGFIERDLESGRHTFHQLESPRKFVDLRPISARGLTTEEVNEAISNAVESCPGGIEDKVVRLIVRDLPRHITRQLDHRQLRDYRRRALHFHLDPRRPEIIRQSAQGAPGRRTSLSDFVRDKLRERMVPVDVDRDALVDLGLRYLKDAEERESAATAPASGVEV